MPQTYIIVIEDMDRQTFWQQEVYVSQKALPIIVANCHKYTYLSGTAYVYEITPALGKVGTSGGLLPDAVLIREVSRISGDGTFEQAWKRLDHNIGRLSIEQQEIEWKRLEMQCKYELQAVLKQKEVGVALTPTDLRSVTSSSSTTPPSSSSESLKELRPTTSSEATLNTPQTESVSVSTTEDTSTPQTPSSES